MRINYERLAELEAIQAEYPELELEIEPGMYIEEDLPLGESEVTVELMFNRDDLWKRDRYGWVKVSSRF